MATVDDLNALLSGLPGYGLITEAMRNSALEGARILDSERRWPGTPDYVPTYDVYFAALSLVGFLQAQPVIRSSSSEGTSVSVDAPNWASLVSYYRSMSPILSSTGDGVLHKVRIPEGPHVFRTDMSERSSGYYGDVDTDLG